MHITKITQISMVRLPSEVKFPVFCYHCGQPTKNFIKYDYPIYHKAASKKSSGAFLGVLFFWGAFAFLFTTVGLFHGFNLSTLIIAGFVALCVFMAIAAIANECKFKESEKYLQPQEYVALSMPVCSACADSTISRKKLMRMTFVGCGLIILPFIILLVTEGDFNFITISSALLSFISGIILFIRAFNYSKGLRSLTIWKHGNRYLWVIPNIKFAKEFALLNGFKDRNTM